MTSSAALPRSDATPSSPPAGAPAGAAPRRHFARFELLRLLGRSQRTMSWLVRDPRAGLELVLVLPRAVLASRAILDLWLADARAAARLSHPQLVPVVEVGQHDDWPYVAYERAAGTTLPERLAAGAPPKHLELTGWWCQVLEGLAFAHEAGVSHGDIQGLSMLIDERDQARLMGLGVSAYASEPAGTESTASLSAVDAASLRRHRDAAQRDVLSVGVLLHQALTQALPMDEADVGRVIDRLPPTGREGLRLPFTVPTPVPDVLRAIVNRATMSRPRQRYLGARTLLRALEGWRDAEASSLGGPLALLMQRVAAVGHLPALPGVAATVTRLSRMDRQRIDAMSLQVLRDPGLSFELLRVVNTALVQGTQMSGNGAVLTVRRAIALLGVEGVRRAAASLRDWPGPLDDAGAAALQATIARVRLAGHLAQALRPAGYDGEIVFLLTLAQNLGRLLLAYHFPDEAQQIAALVRPPIEPDPDSNPAAPPMDEAAATLTVLGTDFDAMATAVLRLWGFGDEVLLLARRLPTHRPVRQPDGDADVLRATCSAANDIVDLLADHTGPRLGVAIEAVAKRYHRILGATGREMEDALRWARDELDRPPSNDGLSEGADAEPPNAGAHPGGPPQREAQGARDPSRAAVDAAGGVSEAEAQ